jgi:hypothetical protein
MQDGENVFNSSTSFGGNSWEAQPTIDGLIVEGKISDLIVVAVDNDQYRIDEVSCLGSKVPLVPTKLTRSNMLLRMTCFSATHASPPVHV